MIKRCIGCGVKLQFEDEMADGYAASDNQKLCKRCFMLKNYGKNFAVLKSNVDYMKILDNIKKDDLVVYISSILTLNLDYLNKFSNVLLVITKRDILPKSIKDEKIISYIKKSNKKILDVIIVSSYKKKNLDFLYDKLHLYGDGRKIYFVGLTNSGKSTLINAMINSYTDNDANLTTSNYPSTTLDIVTVNIGNLLINDTPGILLDNSIINYLDDSYIKRISSKKEIKPITFQLKGKGAISIDKILRLEYDTDYTSMTFYVSNNLIIKRASLNNNNFLGKYFFQYHLDNNQDIVIDDLGFIKFTNECFVRIYYIDSISARVRENMI